MDSIGKVSALLAQCCLYSFTLRNEMDKWQDLLSLSHPFIFLELITALAKKHEFLFWELQLWKLLLVADLR